MGVAPTRAPALLADWRQTLNLCVTSAVVCERPPKIAVDVNPDVAVSVKTELRCWQHEKVGEDCCSGSVHDTLRSDCVGWRSYGLHITVVCGLGQCYLAARAAFALSSAAWRCASMRSSLSRSCTVVLTRIIVTLSVVLSLISLASQCHAVLLAV